MGTAARRPLRSVGEPDRFDREVKHWSTSVIQWLDLGLDLVGMGRVDWTRPHVVVALHEGLVDALLLLSAIPASLRFAARTELKHWPVVGKALEPAGQIILTPERPRAAARILIRQGSAALASGRNPVVFAQGTLVGIEAAFESGAFCLAGHASVDMVPVVIAGTHRVYEWPFTPIVRRHQPVYMEVLDPRPASEIVDVERELRSIALSNQHAPVRRYEPDRDGWWDGYRFEISGDYPDLAQRVAEHRAAQEVSRRLTT